jgi:hypothetical protein
MKKISIYRVDGVTKADILLGTVKERRKIERGNNLVGLMRVARKLFASAQHESFRIHVGGARIMF